MAAHIEEKNAPGKTTLLICLAFVLVQVAFFLGWTWLEYDRSGIEIRVELAPRDPRDLLRGQYLTLNYQFERSSSYQNPEPVGRPPATGGDVYAALRPPYRDESYLPLAYSASLDELRNFLRNDPDETRRDDSTVIVRGRVASARSGSYSFDFGVNRYFVPEGSEEPPMSGTEAVLLVPRDRKPRLLRLLVDGKPWIPKPRGANDGGNDGSAGGETGSPPPSPDSPASSASPASPEDE